jgi:hypothetical protein
MEYALSRKRKEASGTLSLLSQCNLLHHLATEDIEPLLERRQHRAVKAGDIVFRQGDALTRSMSLPRTPSRF